MSRIDDMCYAVEVFELSRSITLLFDYSGFEESIKSNEFGAAGFPVSNKFNSCFAEAAVG